MRVTPNKQQDVYEKIWLPMQQKLQDYLEQFVRHYLAMGGTIPNFNKIYATFKDLADKKAKDEQGVIDIMKNLLNFSTYYIITYYIQKMKVNKN